MPNTAHTHRALVVGAALAFALSGTVLSPAVACAVSAQTAAELSASETKVEQTTAAYSEAVKEIEDLQAKIDANAASISELEAQLPELQEKASSAMRDIYKAKQGANPFMSFIMRSESLDEFITKMIYMNQIQDANVGALDELEATQQQLETEKTELDQTKVQLEAKKEEAAAALSQAQAERSAAQAKAEQEAAEELAALQAAQDTAPAAGEGASGENVQNNGTVAGQTVTQQVSTGAVNWNVSYDEFVSEWTGRINNYLAGSPLAGMGETFAIASWNTGVDPRWSPAISTIESSRGAHCAGAYNAWGWSAKGGGWRSFGSWSDAISQHVAYLGRVYGSTLTPAAAKKYCPPTWQDWYNKVSSQMNRI